MGIIIAISFIGWLRGHVEAERLWKFRVHLLVEGGVRDLLLLTISL